MHNVVLHSNKSACGKSGRLGIDQVRILSMISACYNKRSQLCMRERVSSEHVLMALSAVLCWCIPVKTSW